LDELERLGVRVAFADAPAIGDDPQLRLLTQVQGAFAEYERAKIAERNRRGRLWRSRAGEVVSWKAPYGYRRVPRDASGPARLEVFEPEAEVVRRIYDDYVNGGCSVRHVMRALNAEQVPTPTGKAEWWHSTVCRVLSNEAYIGRVYFNQTESVPARPGSGRRRPTAQRRRPREEWIAIPCPAILDEALFEAAQKVSRDNSRWSPRHLQEEAWLLRGLVRCGVCDTSAECHKMEKASKVHHYYWCHNHASNGVPGQQRCPERNIRSDASTTLSSSRSEPLCSAPSCCAPAKRLSLLRHRPPTTSSSQPSSAGWGASSIPTGPSADASLTCTSPGYWSSAKCNGGHATSTSGTAR